MCGVVRWNSTEEYSPWYDPLGCPVAIAFDVPVFTVSTISCWLPVTLFVPEMCQLLWAQVFCPFP